MATTDTSSLSPGGDPPDQQLSHNPTLPLYPSCTVCGNLMNPSTDRSESGIWLKRCKHCRDKFAKWRAAARKRKRDASTPATHSARRAAHQPQPPANQFISEEQPNIAQQAKSTSGLPRNEGFPRGVVQQPQQDAFHAEDVPIEREHPNDYGALLSYVWRAITTRLHDNNVSAKSLNASQFSFLLPTDATQNADLWEKLLWSPLTLTPAELNSIIRLDTSIPRTKAVLTKRDTVSTVFYLRTFCLSVGQCLEISKSIYQGVKNHALGPRSRWKPQISSLMSEDIVYFRYVGQTTACPIARHHHDSREILGAHPSFATRFINTIRVLFPDVIDMAIVQEFSDATICMPVAQEVADQREKALIALFWNGILNMESGGKRDVIIKEDDIRVFNLLQTETVKLYYHSTTECSTSRTKHVQDYAEAVRKYANSKESTGLGKQEFPENRVNIIFQQAIPRVLRTQSHAVLLAIGYNVGAQNFRHPINYFLTPGRGPNVPASLLSQFSTWEATGNFQESVDRGIVPRLVEDHCLPFIDIFPWPHVSTSDLQGAFELLRQALRSIDPLIVVTYGLKTSKIALANFGHTYEPGSERRLLGRSRPGSIHIRNFDTQARRQQDCDWAVVVESSDPGSLYYSAVVRPAATRLFCLTAAVAWSAASEAMKLSQHHPSSSKYDLCVRIKSRMNSLVGSTTPFGQELQRALEAYDEKCVEARQDCIRSAWFRLARGWAARWEGYDGFLAEDINRIRIVNGTIRLQKNQRATPFDISQLELVRLVLDGCSHQLRLRTKREHWDAARYEVKWLISCGVAVGEPGSPQRRLQAEQLWITLLESCSTVEYSGDGVVAREGFLQWATDLPFGKSYFAFAYNIRQVTAQIPNLLYCFLPRETQEEPDVLEDKAAMFEAWKSLYNWLMPRMASGLSEETLTEAAIKDLSSLVQTASSEGSAPTESSEGYRVLLIPAHEDGYDLATRTTLHWQDEFGRGHEFRNFTFPPGVVPEDPNDERYLVFTAGGIDIRDTFGTTLGLEVDESSFKLRVATIPVHQLIRILADHPRGKALEQLWRQKTGRELESTMNARTTPVNRTWSGNDIVFPKSFFESGTQRAMPYVSYVTKPTYRNEALSLLPADPGDELWLFDRFFAEYYPDGGNIDCVSTSVSAANSVWIKLLEFTKMPKYAHHPHLRTVRALAMSGTSRGHELTRATSQLGLAAFALFENIEETKKTNYWQEGTRQKSGSSKRFNLGKERRPNTIAPVANPELVPFTVGQ